MESSIKITSLKRLISATTDFGRSNHVMEEQITRTRDRLHRGIDLEGNTFAPYKDPARTHPNSRPLERAARLFESPDYDMTQNLEGAEFKATITGQAAKIAYYQNFKRRFVGFSRQDRGSVVDDLKTMIGDAFRRWRSG